MMAVSGTRMPVSARRGISLPEALEVKETSLPGGGRQLSLTGELDLATAPRLAMALAQARARRSSVILDLTACDFVDSTGLALIVNTWREFDETAGIELLVVAGGDGQVARLLRISGVSDHIPIADTVAAARSALG